MTYLLKKGDGHDSLPFAYFFQAICDYFGLNMSTMLHSINIVNKEDTVLLNLLIRS